MVHAGGPVESLVVEVLVVVVVHAGGPKPAFLSKPLVVLVEVVVVDARGGGACVPVQTITETCIPVETVSGSGAGGGAGAGAWAGAALKGNGFEWPGGGWSAAVVELETSPWLGAESDCRRHLPNRFCCHSGPSIG